MQHHKLNTKNIFPDRLPLIGLFIPFICFNNPVIYPFIWKNMPFIRNRGFTLVELIITLTVAGILIAIAAPSMQTFFLSNRLTSQVNELMADINLARNEAIKRNTTAGICVTAAGGNSCVASGNWANGWMVYFVCQTGDPSGCTAGNNIVVKLHEPLAGNNTLTAPGDQLIYGKSGIINSGAGQFTLTDPKTGNTRIVCVVATGRPSLNPGNC